MKMGLLLSAYLLSAITKTNKQRSAYNTILQYLQCSDHNDDKNINYKNYLHRGPCTQCGKVTHKENLDQSHKGAHNLNCKIS